MSISSRFLTALAIMGGTIMASVTSGFTGVQAPDPAYLFEYQSGTVSNPSNWEYTPDETGCGGSSKSCKFQLKKAYVDETTSSVSINATALPNGELPTTTSGSVEIPDGNSNIYVEVYNKD